jgi:hypothetical protein
VAILEFDEAGIHRAVHEDKAELAFPALPVPAIDVRLLAHETSRFRVHQNEHASSKTSKLGPHEHIDEKPDQQLALPGKTKKKTRRRAKAAGLKSAPAV